MDRAELASLVKSAGCRVTRRGADGIPLEFDCEDPWAKVRILDALAHWDARYDPRVRRIAVGIVRALPDTSPGRVARALHRAVLARVRYVGEGIETFQPAAETWALGLGDCDDSARLLVALARSLGLPAEIRALANRRGVPVHASSTVGGMWAECSLPAKFGEHPLAAYRRLRGQGLPTYNYAPSGSVSRETLGDLGDAGTDAARVAARQALSDAWDTVSGLPPKTAAALQMVQAVALGPEGNDGASCWSRCPGVCHNWGGLQLPGSPVTHDGSTPECPAGSAPCVDTTPNADGSSTSYGVCFMTYDSQAAGARAFVQRLIITHQTASEVGSGSADQMAQAMYASHYYQGFGATEAERVDGYAKAIASAAERIAGSLGEPVYVTRGPGGIASRGMAWGAGVAAVALLGWYGYRRGWQKDAAKVASRLKRRLSA